jgi:hypothetical protein
VALPNYGRSEGRPLERSHARIVSRWFEIPIAPGFSGAIWLMQLSITVSTLHQIFSGSCSTHPGCGKGYLHWNGRSRQNVSFAINHDRIGIGRALVNR